MELSGAGELVCVAGWRPFSFVCLISVRSCAAEMYASHASHGFGERGRQSWARRGGGGETGTLTPFPSLAAG